MTVRYPAKTAKPLIALADSQLLFLKEQGQPYIRRLHQLFDNKPILNAAYIGASNGDNPQFYQMFQNAMNAIEIFNCRHITAQASQTDLDYLGHADIILLSGGDVHLGWQTLREFAPTLAKARKNGAVIIGTSAGAIQLGAIGWYDKPHLSNTDIFGTLGFIPAIFSAHENKEQWPLLRQAMTQTGGCLPGIGIPAGAGVLITADNSFQALRKPMITMTIKDNKLQQQSTWQLRLERQSA